MRIEPANTRRSAPKVATSRCPGKVEPAVLDEMYDALSKHLVLFFRDQDLSPEDHYEFAKTFGELAEPHPVYPHLPGFDRVVLLENDGDRPPDTDDWHTDLTFQAKTPFLSVLHAREVPEVGGDTLWANMYRAFDTLPPEMQELCSRLEAVHDMGAFRDSYLGDNNDVAALNEGMAKVGSAVHPVAPKHPVTGKRLLFVNRSFTQHIRGMLKAESDRTLEYPVPAHRHTEQPGAFSVEQRCSRDVGQPLHATFRGGRLSAQLPAHAPGDCQHRSPRQ